jgi:hypothetical protein
MALRAICVNPVKVTLELTVLMLTGVTPKADYDVSVVGLVVVVSDDGYVVLLVVVSG